MRKLLFCLAGLLLFTSAATADEAKPAKSQQTPAYMTAQSELSKFPVSTQDVSLKMLVSIFGPIANIANEDFSQANYSAENKTIVGAGIAYLTTICAVLGSLFIGYGVIIGVVKTAHEGAALGKNWSTAWLPIRIAFGMSMVAPIPAVGGYGLVHVVLASVISISITFANTGWNMMVDKATTRPIITPELQPVVPFVSSVLATQTCLLYMRDQEIGAAKENWRGTSFDDYLYNATTGEKMSSLKLKWSDAWQLNPLVQLKGAWNLMTGSGLSDFDKRLRKRNDVTKVLNAGECGRTFFYASYDAAELASSNFDAKIGLSPEWGEHRTSTEIIRQVELSLRASDIELARKIWDQSWFIAEKLTPRDLSQDVDLSAQASAINQLVRSAASEVSTRAVDEYKKFNAAYIEQTKKNARDQGWAVAGSYSWDLAAQQNTLNKTMKFGINPLSPPDPTEVSATSHREALFRSNTTDRVDKAMFIYRSLDASLQAQANMAEDQAGQWGNIANPIAKKLTDMIRKLSGSSARYPNPLVEIQTLGNSILNAVTAAVGVSAVGDKITKGGLSKAIGAVGGIIETVMFILFALGIVYAFIVPAMPFLMFMFGLFSWLINVLVAYMAAPLWAIAHVFPDGDEFTGNMARRGYMVLLTLAVKPLLMIIGLMAAYVMLMVMMQFFNMVFWPTLDIITADAFNILSIIGYLLLYGVATIIISYRGLSLISNLPGEVMEWVGGRDNPAADNEDKGAVIAAGVAVGSGVKKAGEASAKIGRQTQEDGPASAQRNE